MFRYRLALVILVCFGFVLFLGVALYWGTNQVNRLFQHSQAAYDTFDRYERLSQESYRHFKQRMDKLIINSPAAKDGVDSSRRRLYEAMQDLRVSATEGPTSRPNCNESHASPPSSTPANISSTKSKNSANRAKFNKRYKRCPSFPNRKSTPSFNP